MLSFTVQFWSFLYFHRQNDLYFLLRFFIGVEARILSTLLNELDGIEARRGVFVIATSRLRSSVDAALLRPGRLDEVVAVPLPSAEDAKDIALYALKAVTLGPDVDLEHIIATMVRFYRLDILHHNYFLTHQASVPFHSLTYDISPDVTLFLSLFSAAVLAAPASRRCVAALCCAHCNTPSPLQIKVGPKLQLVAATIVLTLQV